MWLFKRSFRKNSGHFLSFLFCLLLTSCGSIATVAHTLEPKIVPFTPGLPLVVQAGSGSVAITNGIPGQVELSGTASAPEQDAFTVVVQTDGMYITTNHQSGAVNLILRVPPGTSVKVETFGAGIIVQDFDGGIDVRSTASNISIKNMSGLEVLRTNRGSVTVAESRGEIHLMGNYGLISLQDVSGEIDATTILGTVRYLGRIQAGDKVRLETDHGPIDIKLAADSNTTVTVKTTSGVVDCVMPGLAPVGAGCAGILGSGAGSLWVRTVSGEVDLQSIP